MPIQFFAPPEAVKEGRDPWESVELKVIRGRNRDVARIAQDVDDVRARILEIDLELGQLMVRLIAAKIGKPFFALDRDFFLVRFPEACDRTTNQLRDQARDPGATTLGIADHDNILHAA